MSRVPLVLLVMLCLSVGAIGSIFTNESVRTWYTTIDRPAWTPPNWLFGPVWTTLYVLIGIAGWYVWRAPDSASRQRAWSYWWMQLVLNAIWSPLFFGAHAIAAAAIVIVLLLINIALFIRATWTEQPVAAKLFVPYALWVAYASSLNIAIVYLNWR